VELLMIIENLLFGACLWLAEAPFVPILRGRHHASMTGQREGASHNARENSALASPQPSHTKFHMWNFSARRGPMPPALFWRQPNRHADICISCC